MALLSALATQIAIPVCAIIGIAYSCFLWCWFIKRRQEQGRSRKFKRMRARIEREIAEGVNAFLFRRYPCVGVFLVVYAILIFLCLGSVESYSTQSRPCRFDPSKVCKPALATAVVSSVSFLLGAFTSILSGFLGMRIAIRANVGTALAERKGVGEVFIAAYMSGAVMGFLLAANGLLLLYIAISLFKLYYGNDWEGLSEAIAGYGLGGSFMALFGRACVGIYAKAANVYVQLSTVRVLLPPNGRTLAVFGDIVGDIVGDIAGMWTDLSSSYAESSCAVLVVASISSSGIDHNFTVICYPLLIYAMGILVCLITTLCTPNPSKIKELEDVKPKLEKQLMISTMLMTVGIFIVSWTALPSSFTIYNFGTLKVVKNRQLVPCVGVGLWAGLAIGFVNKPDAEDALRNIRDAIAGFQILGLSLGDIPIFAAISVCVSYSFAGFYGIALAAVGMLSTVATRLAINAYGPMSHNAKMARTGKGFAIESAALVSVALFGAFVSRAAIPSVAVMTPKVLIGLIVGSVLPYLFYRATMNSLGSAVCEMAYELSRMEEQLPRRDFEERWHVKAVTIVVFAPLMIGTLFGVETLFAILVGSLGSVVRIAISTSTNEESRKEMKYIADRLSKAANTLPPDSELRKFPIYIEKGNPPKDTSGSPLNSLIQLIAVQMLVFAPFLTTKGGLLLKNL